MVEVVTVVLTVIVLTLYGAGLSWLWDHGFWYVTAASGPAVIAIAYALSSPADRAEFWQMWRSIFRINRR